tara:strand:+ start:320 stop:475 length:156 start_codon:yes stop_codon:yes gene_type:complete
MALKEKEKPVKKETYQVVKEFTLDKVYKIKDSIELPKGELKDVLITNKFIK